MFNDAFENVGEKLSKITRKVFIIATVSEAVVAFIIILAIVCSKNYWLNFGRKILIILLIAVLFALSILISYVLTLFFYAYGKNTWELENQTKILRCFLKEQNKNFEGSFSEEKKEPQQPTSVLCKRCGHKNPLGAAFCEECGLKLD